MRIVELKSQNVKIIYKPLLCQLKAGDFVSFKEGELTLIAQVYKISNYPQSSEYNLAELTFVLTNKYGKIYKWNGELVSAEAQTEITPINFIENYINQENYENTFSLGYCNGNVENPFKFSIRNFITPSIIAYDKYSDNINFIKNLATQFVHLGKKLLIIDYKGNINVEGAIKVLAGFQDKLALNSEILENLSDKITDGISLESKAIIDNILVDLTKYADNITSKFIPISNLINVIDNIYKQSKISQLILLKNKLRKYQTANIFADSIKDTNSLNAALEQDLPVIFDLSNVPFEWQNEFCLKSLNILKEKNEDVYFHTIVDEKTFDNSILKYLLFKAEKDKIKPLLSMDYRHGAFNTILEFCQNIFFLKTRNNLKKHQNINDIIQAIPQDYFIAYGKLTSNLLIPASMDNFNTSIIEEYNKITENQNSNETLDIIEQHIDISSLSTPKAPLNNINMNVLNTALEPEPKILFTPVEINNTSTQTIKIVDKELPENQNELNTSEQQENLNVQTNQEENLNNIPNIPNAFENINTDEISERNDEDINIENFNKEAYDEQIIFDESIKSNNVNEISLNDNDSLDTIEPLEPLEIVNDEIPEKIPNELPLEDDIQPVEIINEKNFGEETENTSIVEDIQTIEENNSDMLEFNTTTLENQSEQNILPQENFETQQDILSSNDDISTAIEKDDNENLQAIEDIENIDFEEIVENSVDQTDNNIEELAVDDLDFLDEIPDTSDTQVKTEEITSGNTMENDEELLDLLSDADEDIFEESNTDSDFDEILEENTQKSERTKHQKLPVYSADYDNQNEKNIQIDFKEGDLVKHNKYGIGTVNKITSHGDKILCHINFDDFGRRLLDPVMSQLEKIE